MSSLDKVALFRRTTFLQFTFLNENLIIRTEVSDN